MKLISAILMSLLGAPLAAQTTAATIDSGMTQPQVIARLGVPLSARTYDGHTYLFYKNGCERTCGMNDFVVLDSGKVVDAVFRSPARRYTGHSSSPKMIPAAEARHGEPTAPLRTPATPPRKPTS